VTSTERRKRPKCNDFWNATAFDRPICRRRKLVAWREDLILLNLAGMDPLLKLLHENVALKAGPTAAMPTPPRAKWSPRSKAYEASEAILTTTVLNEE
jgi:hypothetical protein